MPTIPMRLNSLIPMIEGGIESIYNDADLDETAVAVKASAGQVYFVYVLNLDATPVYVHLYDAAQGDVTVGTTSPKITFPVPSQGDANGAGAMIPLPWGIQFDTAITAACTTTHGGSSGPGANEVPIAIGYE